MSGCKLNKKDKTELKKVNDKLCAMPQTGSSVYSDPGNNYTHPFPAIGEFTDNVRDLVCTQQVNRTPYATTVMDISFDPIVNDNRYCYLWSFLNNGNGIDSDTMNKNLFAIANSDKHMTTHIGRYGVGLKGGAMYLGDYFFIVSIDKSKNTRTLGFYSDENAKIEGKGLYFCKNYDTESKDVLEFFNIVIKRFTHVNEIEEIDALFEKIDPNVGGTLVVVGVSNETFKLKYGEQLELIDNQQTPIANGEIPYDILVKLPYKGDNFKDTETPRFTVSLRSYLEMLYLYNPDFDWQIRLFGIPVEFLKLREQNSIEIGRTLGLSEGRAAGENFYCCYQTPSNFYDSRQTCTLTHLFKRSSISDKRMAQYFAKRGSEKPKAEITLLKRLKGSNGVFSSCDYTLFFSNGRFVDIVPIGIQKQHGNSLRKGKTVIVDSNCLLLDVSKQYVIQGNTVYTSIRDKVSKLLHYNYNPSGQKPIITAYKINTRGEPIVTTTPLNQNEVVVPQPMSLRELETQQNDTNDSNNGYANDNSDSRSKRSKRRLRPKYPNKRSRDSSGIDNLEDSIVDVDGDVVMGENVDDVNDPPETRPTKRQTNVVDKELDDEELSTDDGEDNNFADLANLEHL